MTRSSGVEAVLDDAQAADELAERDVFLLRDVVGVDHEDEFAHLLGADRGVRHQQRLVGRRARHAHAREHAGREQRRSGWRTRARPRIVPDDAVDHVVDEVHLAACGRNPSRRSACSSTGDAAVAAGDVACRCCESRS